MRLYCSMFLLLHGPALVEANDIASQIVLDVIRGNATVQAARDEWEAARQRPEIAGTLPDPTINYGYFFSNVETRVGAQNQKVGLSQRIPFPGKLTLAGEKARQEALMAMWRYQSTIQAVVVDAKIHLAELYRIDRSQVVLEKQDELLDAMVNAVQSRFEATEASLPDLLKTTVEREQIQVSLRQLAGSRAAVVASLNAMRDGQPDATIPPLKALRPQAIARQGRLLELALQYRQELQQAGVAIERDRLGLELARKERWPDFTIGVDYTQVNESTSLSPPADDGQDAVFAYVSLNIPIWRDKLNAQEAAASSQLLASEARETQMRRDTQAEVLAALAKVRSFEAQVAMYEETILPEATKTYESLNSAYGVGKSSLLDLLDGSRSLLKVKLDLAMKRSELARAVATLEGAVGVDFTHLPELEPDSSQTQRNHETDTTEPLRRQRTGAAGPKRLRR